MSSVYYNGEEYVMKVELASTPRTGDDLTRATYYNGKEFVTRVEITNAEDIGGGDTEVAWDDIKGKPSTFPPSSHTHSMSDVTGLSDALTGLSDALTGKMNASVVDSLEPLEFTEETTVEDVVNAYNNLLLALKGN